MPQPTKQHLQLVGGANAVNSTIYTSSLISIGDALKITGTGSNDGVFTVTDVVDTLSSNDAAGTTFTQASCTVSSGDATITHSSNTQIIAGLSVSGTGIQTDTYIASITDSTHFEMSKTASSSGTRTLTFGDMDIYYVLKGRTISDDSSGGDPTIQINSQGDKMVALGDVDSKGGVDVWSTNATTSYGAKDNGWTTSAISPTLSGNDAKYIYHIADGTVRVCDINETNSTIIKWYGYVQGNQFHATTGLVFAEWQEHPNSLAPPKIATSFTYAYGTSSHAGGTATNYYNYLTDDTCDTDHTAGSGSTFGSNPKIVRMDATGSLAVGMCVTGTGIAAGSVVSQIDSGTLFRVDKDTTATNTNEELTFFHNRGVAIIKKTGSDQLQMGVDLSTSATGVKFENGSGADKSGRAVVGEVISIKEASGGVGDLGEYPKEFLFCKQGYSSATGTSTYSRAYGGALGGTAPFDFADNETPIIVRGTGWNIAVSAGTGNGDWEEGTYEFYETFIYDNNQESLPVQIGDGASTIAAFTVAVTVSQTLRVSVYADLAYSGRITGGRIYTRLENTDDDLVLLADIDIVKGMRTSLDGDHRAWTYEAGKGYHVVSGTYGNAIKPNLDTYTTINAFSPDLKFLGIGGTNEIYKASVVANRRTFVANVKLKAGSGELEKFGDRIMYSEIGKFDTFLEYNFIDVSTGDYGEYTALESFADRLLAFKHNLVHIINVSSPSVSSWYLEETIKYFGVNFPFSVAKTKYGIAWVSDDGCYLYDGRNVRNLIDKKIAVSKASFTDTEVDWNSWYRGSAITKDVMLGYDPISNSLIMMRSPNDASDDSNQSFVYDFDSNGWTYHTTIFTNHLYYTNFITDWNNNLSLGVFDGSTDVEFKKFLPISVAQSGQEFNTKDIDFGHPGLIKKIYKVTMTYKSSAEQQTPLYYAINGSQSFSSFASDITPQGNTGGAGYLESSLVWDVATFTPSSPVSCQSIQFQLDLPTSGTFEVNDMTIEYRTISNKNVS